MCWCMQTASRSGDMRQVLDACAAAIDIVVQEATETAAAAEPGALSHPVCNPSVSIWQCFAPLG